MRQKVISIRQKFTVAMVYILLFELIIYAIFVFFGGTLGMIVTNVYGNLKETTQIRTTDIENSLNSVSEIANNSYKEINSTIVAGIESGDSGCDAAFLGLIPRMQLVSSGENITGIFAIVGSDTGADRLPALYMRKADRSLQNQSYTVNISSENIIQQSGILRAQNWSSSINLKENNGIDFFSEPIRIANENPTVAATELGYWSMPYQINFDGEYAIAYSLPLRDDDGNCIGVYGVEINLSRLKEKLPYLELNSKGMGSYVMLCKSEYDDNIYHTIAVSGDTFDSLNNYSDTVTFRSNLTDNSMYTLNTRGKHSTDVYSTLDELKLWEHSSYSHKVWVLSGVVDSVYLNDLENSIRFNVLFAFAITMLLGLIFAWIMSRVIATPIHKFLYEIKNIRADNPVVPSRSSISEINDLAKVVENLTDDLTDFSVKVSTILDLAGLQCGAFEYDQSSDFVYCTDAIYTLLNMEKSEDKLFVRKEVFEKHLALICQDLTPGIDCVYKVMLPNGGMKFYHMKTAINNGKILGVIQNTTEETVNEMSRAIAQDHDKLTGLLNRAAFRGLLNNKLTSGKNIFAALVHCNIDKMSDVNMRYGNDIGDRYLQSVSTVLKKNTKLMNCSVARTAGDEFKLLVINYNPDEIKQGLENLFNQLYELKISTPDGSIPVQISIGIALYPVDANSHSLLEQYAEFAMRQVKRSNGNTYKYFDKAAFEESERNIRSSRNIEMLISEGLIRYAFQPIINARTGEIYGYEALMRPDSTNAITPHDVIVFATEENKLDVIERITWFTALEDFSMQVDSRVGKKMFLNSIPNQILTDEQFAEIESRYGEYLGNIVLEIIENEQTDSVLTEKKKALVEKWGCMLALDDYGSGYANDNTLLYLKPDVIKLDIEMITGIETDSDRQTLVKNIIAYAHQRNILVLGEGIETYTQMRTLIHYGVDLMQGFYLAKPSFDAVDRIDDKFVNEILEIRSKQN
jgi:diguanylate cyclase (GGDEF)-like protein